MADPQPAPQAQPPAPLPSNPNPTAPQGQQPASAAFREVFEAVCGSAPAATLREAECISKVLERLAAARSVQAVPPAMQWQLFERAVSDKVLTAKSAPLFASLIADDARRRAQYVQHVSRFIFGIGRQAFAEFFDWDLQEELLLKALATDRLKPEAVAVFLRRLLASEKLREASQRGLDRMEGTAYGRFLDAFEPADFCELERSVQLQVYTLGAEKLKRLNRLQEEMELRSGIPAGDKQQQQQQPKVFTPKSLRLFLDVFGTSQETLLEVPLDVQAQIVGCCLEEGILASEMAPLFLPVYLADEPHKSYEAFLECLDQETFDALAEETQRKMLDNALNMRALNSKSISMLSALMAPLETVGLSEHSNLDLEAFRELFATCTNVVHLDLRHCWGMTDEALEILADEAPSCVRTLLLADCWNISDDGVIAVVRALGPRLVRLDLAFNPLLTNATAAAVYEHCANLEELRIVGCKQITKAFVRELAQGASELRVKQ